MAIQVPQPTWSISAEDFGQPVANEVNRLTTLTAPSAWTALPFAAPWTNFGSGYANGEYRKIGDIVYIRGFITPGTSAPASSLAFTLPTGFRPPVSLQDVIMYYNGTTQVPAARNMNPTGQWIMVTAMSGSAAIGLSVNYWFSTV